MLPLSENGQIGFRTNSSMGIVVERESPCAHTHTHTKYIYTQASCFIFNLSAKRSAGEFMDSSGSNATKATVSTMKQAKKKNAMKMFYFLLFYVFPSDFFFRFRGEERK